MTLLHAERSALGSFGDWIRDQGLWIATSAVAHALLLSVGLLIAGVIYVAPRIEGSAPSFESVTIDTALPTLENFSTADTPIDPTELNTDSLTLEAPSVMEQINTTPDDPFSEAGGGLESDTPTTMPGMGGLDLKAFGSGPTLSGPGGIGGGSGEGTSAGLGNHGGGFGGRGTGVRQAMLASGGGTKQSERAVAAALDWLARHQNSDGSWSLSQYIDHCKGEPCAGAASSRSDTAATAFGLLPFLAAGQTHQTKGPYQKNVQKGLYWLARQQTAEGDLSGRSGGHGQMYAHGLAAITVCEAFGLSGDKTYGKVAQDAIHFIERSQNPQTGGWRYKPLDTGDTSVYGWEVMALKDAQMAGIKVSSQATDDRWLKSVSEGNGRFSYLPGRRGTESMTAVGLLCTQYLGGQRNDPIMLSGRDFLMSHPPTLARHNVYYWYYATQVMHNMPGYEWDTWNRKMRKLLIETQSTKGCATGSWDPRLPAVDSQGDKGGRIMVTSLSCLTLEVYYRYLPLYKLDGQRVK